MELPDDLIKLQRAADDEGKKLEPPDGDELTARRDFWFDKVAEAQAAVTAYTKDSALSRFDVEEQLRTLRSRRRSTFRSGRQLHVPPEAAISRQAVEGRSSCS
ncbi:MULTISPECIES: hypothetical protein [unclassified Streptomyces]|uniref:hypothetical protein n=1 Tax=unclassified Streptomyces TaxID=2593676 RepID=UPI002E17BFD5|nr:MULTISPECIES: hypothetical protein [unclassified Streptomyces]